MTGAPRTAGRTQPSASQPCSEASRGERVSLGGLLLANDQHLYLLIRNAWRCRRLSAQPGRHGHPPPRETTPLGHLCRPRGGATVGATFPHAPARRGGRHTLNTPFLPKPAAASRHRVHEPGVALEQVPQHPAF